MIETLQSLLQGFLDWLPPGIPPARNDGRTRVPALPPGPSKWPFVIPVGAVVLFASLVLHPDRAPNPVIDPDTGQIVTGPTPDVGGLVNLPLLGRGLAVVLVGIVG